VTILVPIMLFGWVALTIGLSRRMPHRQAVLCAVIGGVLFLPMAAYDLPGLTSYNKASAIALGLLLAEVFQAGEKRARFKPTLYDVPMILWCFVSPLVTSLSNGLGLYDALSSALTRCLTLGVVYWVGRAHFSELSSARELCQAIVVGGLLYVPLTMFEVRMSPQLSNILYGFFPHSFGQHFRYGGYRPIVFMQHGLMVALWMAESFVVAFWMWRSKGIARIKEVPLGLFVLALLAAAVLCKSGNGWVFLTLGGVLFFYYQRSRSTRLLQALILVIPAYMLVRVTSLVTAQQVLGLAGRVFDLERIASLGTRLLQEDLFSAHAAQRALFGWGGWSRGWPVDPYTGERLISMVDSLFIITYSTSGLFGLLTLFSALLVGPWTVLRSLGRVPALQNAAEPESYPHELVVLSLVVTIFMIDALLNSMINQIYVLCAGALVSYGIRARSADRPSQEIQEDFVERLQAGQP
jgi:hypothetical protein